MENFANIAGHKNAKKLLTAALKSGKMAHSYLFIGAENLGKFLLAKEFAKSLACRNGSLGNPCGRCVKCLAIESETDPDVFFVNSAKAKINDESRKGKKAISIEEIRTLQHHLSLFPYDSKYKIAIVNEAHKFTAEAVNALLKTLEEPKGNSVIILIADDSRFLLKTMISRTQIIRFWPLKSGVIEKFLVERGAEKKKAEEISAISFGKPGLAVDFFKDEKKISDYRGKNIDFWNFFQNNLPEKMVFLEDLSKREEDITDVLRFWLLCSRKAILKEYFSENYASGDYSAWKNMEKLLNFADNLVVILNLINNSNINKRLSLEILALGI